MDWWWLLLLVPSTHVHLLTVRKCCGEGQLITEDAAECRDFDLKLLKPTIRNDPNWPWWFPSDFPLLANGTKSEERSFPDRSDFLVMAGCGAGCPEHLQIALPSFFYSYQFFDDGSLKLVKSPNQHQDLIFPPLSFCVDRLFVQEDNPPEYVVHLCPCNTTVCFLKCCGPHSAIKLAAGEQDITENSCKQETRVEDWKPPSGVDSFVLNRFPTCLPDEDLFIPNVGVKSTYEIQIDGSAQLTGADRVAKLKYCVENVIHFGKQSTFVQLIRCYPRVTKTSFLRIRRLVYGSLSGVGAFFLALTLAMYALTPREKTVNDLNLISQTLSLLLGYSGMAVTQLALFHLPHPLCVLLGFITLYSFLASFFWLNVLCIDLAWAFSEMRLIRDMLVWQKRRRFLQYSIYSWTCPACIVFTVALADFVPGVPASIAKPDFTARCWFSNDSPAKLVYFYGPIAVLLAVNVILFVYTAYKIMSAHNSSSSLVISSRVHERQRFILYIKLFMLMGLSWVLELVSWAVGGPDYYWYGTDLINLLRAVFIFVTLCCKREVLQDLKEKLKLSSPQRGRTTASTSVISLSNNAMRSSSF